MKKEVIVIVESPGKVKTIEKYLKDISSKDFNNEKNFKVIASYGHIRQLKSKPDSVKYENEDFNFEWESDTKKINNILKSCENAHEIILATDMDREGEAIAWHISQVLKKKKITATMGRICFVEITKKAIQESLKNIRQVDIQLVHSYLARVGLDYSVGYTLSPLLWKKMPGIKNQSVGRVQSATLNIISEVEKQIQAFEKKKYYVLNGNFSVEKKPLSLKLTNFDGKKFIKTENKEEAEKITEKIKKDCIGKNFKVENIQTKVIKINPDAPFITSSLQQEANRKLNLKISDTMRIAQSLYEGVEIDGTSMALITYMRTDSTNMSEDAIGQIRDFLSSKHPDLLSKTKRQFKSKVKNAQEAHECIRPTDINITPESLKGKIEARALSLYSLIWYKSIESQMESAQKSQESFDFVYEKTIFSGRQSKFIFKGFLFFHEESKNIKKSEKSKTFAGENSKNFQNEVGDKSLQDLPSSPAIEPVGEKTEENENYKGDITENDVFFNIKEKDEYKLEEIICNEYETAPPSRFSEGSLVEEMKNLGIGRPSTYGTIIETLKKREYIQMKGRAMQPTTKGIVVCLFLRDFCAQYVNTDFTAEMEKSLDNICEGISDYILILKEFIDVLENSAKNVDSISIHDVINKIGENFSIFSGLKCSCGENLQIRIKGNIYLLCAKCAKFFNNSQETEIDENIKIIKNEKYTCIQLQDMKIFLPQKFSEELDKDKIEFLKRLPIEIKVGDETAMLGMSKYGFYIKYKEKYHNLKTLEEFMKVDAKYIKDLTSKYVKKT